jgi:diphosphoinositol-polyphosphate diphosphatase
MDSPSPPGKAKAGVVATRTTANADLEVLLITSRKHPHSWIFPVGTVEPGESLERAAARECAEESGYTVEVCRLLAELELADEADGAVGRFFFFAASITGECATYETDRQRRWVRLSQVAESVAEVFAPVARAAVANWTPDRLPTAVRKP